MLIGIVFMLYTLVLILALIGGLAEIDNLSFSIFCIALQYITWIMLGLIAIGVL